MDKRVEEVKDKRLFCGHASPTTQWRKGVLGLLREKKAENKMAWMTLEEIFSFALS